MKKNMNDWKVIFEAIKKTKALISQVINEYSLYSKIEDTEKTCIVIHIKGTHSEGLTFPLHN